MSSKERETRIANILGTYFSDASLLWDKVMLSKMLKDPEKSKLIYSLKVAFVSLNFCIVVTFEELSNLPKFKSITATAQEILSAAESHLLNRLKVINSINLAELQSYFLLVGRNQAKDWPN